MSLKDMIFKQLKENKEEPKHEALVTNTETDIGNFSATGFALHTDRSNSEEIRHILYTIAIDPQTKLAKIVSDIKYINKDEAFEQMKINIANEVFKE